MAKVEVVDATEAHARALAGVLRNGDRDEITSCGLDPETTIVGSFRNSLLRRTALVDGRVGAVWGVAGAPLGLVGSPWLLTGLPVLEVSAIRIARIYREQVNEMLRLFPVLQNYVDARYAGAVRLLGLSGFVLDEPAPYGPHNAMFRRFEARV